MDSESAPWHDPSLCFNPAVHRIKQALFHAAIVPDLTSHPVPPPHPDLTKYFDPPWVMSESAQVALETCQAAFKVSQIQKRPPKRKAERHVEATGDEELLLEPAKKIARTQSPSAVDKSEAFEAALEMTQPSTEVDETRLLETPRKAEHTSHVAKSMSPEEDDNMDDMIDHGIAPGRIIGATKPLQDFRNNIQTGDLISKAVEDMAAVIQELVLQPFTERRQDELLMCLEGLRAVCLKEDEIEAWNE